MSAPRPQMPETSKSLHLRESLVIVVKGMGVLCLFCGMGVCAPRNPCRLSCSLVSVARLALCGSCAARVKANAWRARWQLVGVKTQTLVWGG